ncbi:MAG: flavodoxin family protein [Firmicutes bacterium]|nr:flavodoxin family protein [Bacillota bacterium]
MKALVLFRSYHGNTKQIAEGIAKELGTQGIETIVQDLR